MFIDSIGNRTYFQHGGANDSFRCQYFASLTGGEGVVLMENSDQDGIVRDVINSVAQVYHWKNFYNSQKKRIIHVSDHTLQQYVGDYALNETNISVYKKDNNIYLSLT